MFNVLRLNLHMQPRQGQSSTRLQNKEQQMDEHNKKGYVIQRKKNYKKHFVMVFISTCITDWIRIICLFTSTLLCPLVSSWFSKSALFSWNHFNGFWVIDLRQISNLSQVQHHNVPVTIYPLWKPTELYRIHFGHMLCGGLKGVAVV